MCYTTENLYILTIFHFEWIVLKIIFIPNVGLFRLSSKGKTYWLEITIGFINVNLFINGKEIIMVISIMVHWWMMSEAHENQHRVYYEGSHKKSFVPPGCVCASAWVFFCILRLSKYQWIVLKYHWHVIMLTLYQNTKSNSLEILEVFI